MHDPKIIVALDYPDEAMALTLISQLQPAQCRLKIGKTMFTRFGPALIEKIQNKGFQVFLDLKYHDIPNTVARACEAAAELGVWMLNVHASGGRRMLEAAANALANKQNRPHLIGVTVLTSLSDDDLVELGIRQTAVEHTLSLACLSHDCGLDGVVCSAQEASILRDQHGMGFLRVTPGIRPLASKVDDQRRIMTADAAIQAGSSYLVMGRPITQSDNPAVMVDEINASISLLS